MGSRFRSGARRIGSDRDEINELLLPQWEGMVIIARCNDAWLAQPLRMCKLYVLLTGETLRRLETGGGWRRTCVWRERRWPSFIIWRWAGPAQGGWIHCPRKAPRLLLPRRHRHPSISMSLRRAGVRPAPHGLRPGGSRPGRRSGEPRSRLARAPGVRPAPAAASPVRARAPAGPRRASAPRRDVAVGGGNPAYRPG